MESIILKIENGIAFVTLNRPDVYNSFNREMALGLQKIIDDAVDNKEVRCIYITGNGKAFSAGQDLQEATAEGGLEISDMVREHYNPLIQKMREIEKPIVAAVNGVAAGAGANIALACDITVAKASASFIQAFSKIGLIPDSGGTFFLPRIIGMQRAAALTMLGEKVSAADAEKMGMIYKSFPDETFEEESLAIAKKLASMPTRGIGLTKRAFNYSCHNDLDTQLGIEEQLQAAASITSDYQEGVSAFLEKRKPTFTGQ